MGSRDTWFQRNLVRRGKRFDRPMVPAVVEISGDSARWMHDGTTPESGSFREWLGLAYSLTSTKKPFVSWTLTSNADLFTVLRGKVVGSLLAEGWTLTPLLSGTNVIAVDLALGGRIVTVKDITAVTRHDAGGYAEWGVAVAGRDRLEVIRDAVFVVGRTFESLFGSPLGYSAGGTAWQAWLRTVEDAWYVPGKRWQVPWRDGYFGGALYARSGVSFPNVAQYDIRSAYGWAMRQGVPYGQPVRVQEYRGDDVPGLYRVRFLPGRVPCLKVRTGSGVMAMVDSPSSGEHETTATSIELQTLRETGGTFDVLDGWVWQRLVKPFDAFVDICEETRMRNADTASGKGVKVVQNALTGRLATATYQDSYVLSAARPDGAEWFPATLRGMHEQVWCKRDERGGTMVHWGLWITATVRARIWREVDALGLENVVYVDTDGICTINGAQPTLGTGYGRWREVRKYRVWRAERVKGYGGITDDGEVIYTVSGMRDAWQVPTGLRDALLAAWDVLRAADIAGTFAGIGGNGPP